MRYRLTPIHCRPWLLNVGCKTAIELRQAGFDASFMKGGHSAWKAMGGATKLYP